VASQSQPGGSDAEYLAEVRASGQGKSEDYERWKNDDATLLSWKKYYVGGGKFKNDYGDIVDKPDERGPNTPGNRNGTGDQGDYGRGYNNDSLDSTDPNWDASKGRIIDRGGGGGGGGKAQAATTPETFGNQLGMTGNPMQDMLINQFNTGQNATYTQGSNLFGLGEDRKMGGAGANADQQSQTKAQSLTGGGLWWGQSDGSTPDTFQGFRADQKNATAPVAPAAGAAAAAGSGPCPPGQVKNAKGRCVAASVARANENAFAAKPNEDSIAGMANNQYNAGGA
jgi:hypothetical protein